MAYSLTVDIVDHRDGEIHATYTFWGDTEPQARSRMRQHEQDCSCFAAAVLEGRTIEEIEEIDDDELPQVDDEDDEEDEHGADR
jgi:hypothetical protein